AEAAAWGREAGRWDRGTGAVAREPRAEMLHLVGGGHASEADERGTLPIIAGQATDDTAERAPVVELAWREADVDDERRPPPFLEVIAVPRRARRQRGGERRGPALEVRTRAAHAVAIDHHSGVPIGDVLAQNRRHDRLVVDAGIGHQYAQRLQRGNRAAFEVDHPGLLFEPMRSREVGAARIRDGGNPYTPRVRRQPRQPFEPFDAGWPQRLGVGHDVGLGYRDEI